MSEIPVSSSTLSRGYLEQLSQDKKDLVSLELNSLKDLVGTHYQEDGSVIYGSAGHYKVENNKLVFYEGINDFANGGWARDPNTGQLPAEMKLEGNSLVFINQDPAVVIDPVPQQSFAAVPAQAGANFPAETRVLAPLPGETQARVDTANASPELITQERYQEIVDFNAEFQSQFMPVLESLLSIIGQKGKAGDQTAIALLLSLAPVMGMFEPDGITSVEDTKNLHNVLIQFLESANTSFGLEQGLDLQPMIDSLHEYKDKFGSYEAELILAIKTGRYDDYFHAYLKNPLDRGFGYIGTMPAVEKTPQSYQIDLLEKVYGELPQDLVYHEVDTSKASDMDRLSLGESYRDLALIDTVKTEAEATEIPWFSQYGASRYESVVLNELSHVILAQKYPQILGSVNLFENIRTGVPGLKVEDNIQVNEFISDVTSVQANPAEILLILSRGQQVADNPAAFQYRYSYEFASRVMVKNLSNKELESFDGAQNYEEQAAILAPHFGKIKADFLAEKDQIITHLDSLRSREPVISGSVQPGLRDFTVSSELMTVPAVGESREHRGATFIRFPDQNGEFVFQVFLPGETVATDLRLPSTSGLYSKIGEMIAARNQTPEFEVYRETYRRYTIVGKSESVGGDATTFDVYDGAGNLQGSRILVDPGVSISSLQATRSMVDTIIAEGGSVDFWGKVLIPGALEIRQVYLDGSKWVIESSPDANFKTYKDKVANNLKRYFDVEVFLSGNPEVSNKELSSRLGIIAEFYGALQQGKIDNSIMNIGLGVTSREFGIPVSEIQKALVDAAGIN